MGGPGLEICVMTGAGPGLGLILVRARPGLDFGMQAQAGRPGLLSSFWARLGMGLNCCLWSRPRPVDPGPCKAEVQTVSPAIARH